jgi:hypothetical protein
MSVVCFLLLPTTNLLYLKGLVYYGGTHFTSRIISKDGLMMELQMEAKLFRMAIFLQWQI